MSTYYESYIFVRSNNDELEYIGPYSQNGKPCSLFEGTGSYVGEVVGEVMHEYLKNLKIKDASDPLKFLGFKPNEENSYGWEDVQCTVLSWNELDNGERGPVRYGYIYKTLKRNLEINGFEKDSYLSNYYDEEDDPKCPGIICVDEFEKLSYSVSLLSMPEPMKFESEEDLLNQLVPNVDGLIIKDAGRQAVYLPEVWEQLPEKQKFLNSLKQKAGLRPDWFSNTFQAYRFRTELID